MSPLSRRRLLQSIAVALPAIPSHLPAAEIADLKNQVLETEKAFARSMAERDLEAFRNAVADEAVFFGERQVLRGRDAVVTQWKQWFQGPKAPFSWRPERVEVLDSRQLAFSTGPVFDPDGARSGTFNSVWRREPDGKWRIIFDIGCPRCPDR
ncbi:MAG: nuclear transport factor 2 family protein [Verrucomicrobiales bacterium]|nr:nuclear transport factor 2 family protein [Verrucomicrobiales bacterium]